jgi:pimeloyl-ACP methyl ester carboxylesterase
VLYDQVGCGRSSHFPEKRLDTDFWTPELFVAELDSLLSHLGIADDFDLLGQSW